MGPMFVTVLHIILHLQRLLTTHLTQLAIQLDAFLLHALRELNPGSPLHRIAKSAIFFVKADPKDQSNKIAQDREVGGRGEGYLLKTSKRKD